MKYVTFFISISLLISFQIYLCVILILLNGTFFNFFFLIITFLLFIFVFVKIFRWINREFFIIILSWCIYVLILIGIGNWVSISANRKFISILCLIKVWILIWFLCRFLIILFGSQNFGWIVVSITLIYSNTERVIVASVVG